MNLKALLLLLFVISFITASHAQQKSAEVQKQKLQIDYYEKLLQVDSIKAGQVAQVQDNYKLALGVLIADSALNDTARRVRIKALIDEKNRKLRLLLNPNQQGKMIPTTEQVSSPAIKQ